MTMTTFSFLFSFLDGIPKRFCLGKGQGHLVPEDKFGSKKTCMDCLADKSMHFFAFHRLCANFFFSISGRRRKAAKISTVVINEEEDDDDDEDYAPLEDEMDDHVVDEDLVDEDEIAETCKGECN